MSTRILAVAALASTSALAATPLKLAGNFAGQDFFNGAFLALLSQLYSHTYVGFRINASAVDTNNQGNIQYVTSFPCPSRTAEG